MHVVGYYTFDDAQQYTRNLAPADTPNRAPNLVEQGDALARRLVNAADVAADNAASAAAVRNRAVYFGLLDDGDSWRDFSDFDARPGTAARSDSWHTGALAINAFDFGGGGEGGAVCMWIRPTMTPRDGGDQRLFSKQSSTVTGAGTTFQLSYYDGEQIRASDTDHHGVRFRLSLQYDTDDATVDSSEVRYPWRNPCCRPRCGTNRMQRPCRVQTAPANLTLLNEQPRPRHWSHVCAGVHGLQSLVQIYVDGVQRIAQQGCTVGTCPYAPRPQAAFQLGNAGTDDSEEDLRGFVGAIDAVYLLNGGPLTAANVALMMTSRGNSVPPALRFAAASAATPSSLRTPSSLSTSTSPPATSLRPAASTDSSTVAIIAATVAGVALACIAVAVVCCAVLFARRRHEPRRQARQRNGSAPDTTTTATTTTKANTYAAFSQLRVGNADYETAALGVPD